MSYQLTSIALIFIVIAFGLLRRCSLYSPLFINAYSWLIVFIPGMFFYADFYPLDEKVYTAWVIWFSITSLCFFILQPKSLKHLNISLINPLKISINYTLFIWVSLLWLSYRIWIIGNAGSAHFFLNLRLSSMGIDGFETIGIIGKLYPLITALFIFEQLNFKKERNMVRISLFIWLMVYAIGTMGKFAILTPIFIWVITAGLQGRVSKVNLIKIIIVTIGLMLFAHFIRAGDGNEFSLFKMIALYTYSPIVALGYLDTSVVQNTGEYSLRFFYAVGHSMGLADKPVDVIMDYVSVPELTNVYTVLLPFYKDFSLYGVGIFAFVYGALFGSFYSLANKKTTLYLAIYISIALALFSQFIVESIFTTMSIYIQVILCLCLIYSLAKRQTDYD